ncbi:MAG: hypothetical protein SFT91_00670 [Rickettsiaceae bacterium]|nr:hypothetical protein [Rickettsiaceae bacterium]
MGKTTENGNKSPATKFGNTSPTEQEVHAILNPDLDQGRKDYIKALENLKKEATKIKSKTSRFANKNTETYKALESALGLCEAPDVIKGSESAKTQSRKDESDTLYPTKFKELKAGHKENKKIYDNWQKATDTLKEASKIINKEPSFKAFAKAIGEYVKAAVQYLGSIASTKENQVKAKEAHNTKWQNMVKAGKAASKKLREDPFGRS